MYTHLFTADTIPVDLAWAIVFLFLWVVALPQPSHSNTLRLCLKGVRAENPSPPASKIRVPESRTFCQPRNLSVHVTSFGPPHRGGVGSRTALRSWLDASDRCRLSSPLW